jgi:O-antigen/teichoic acid export membrane protein
VSTRDLLPLALPGVRPCRPLCAPARISAANRESMETEAELVTPGLSLRSNFAWILTGNVVYAICQCGVIVALAKLGSSSMIGQFSLGLAIAAPVLMFTNLNLRAVQATDARRTYSFGEYLRLRIAMTLGGLAVIAGIVSFGNYQRQTAMVILIVALAKGIETVSDIHYGLFQLNDRLDQSGRSLIIRGILSVVALSTGIYVTHNILWGCVSLALVWLIALIFFDARQGRHFVVGPQEFGRPASLASRLFRQAQGLTRSWDLMRIALPLGIGTTMAALNLNMPRYFIHARLGERQLGIYSAMAYATVPMILVSDSLGHSVVPRLARLYAGARLAEYRALLLRMLAIGASLGLAGLAVARFLGVRLLRLFFGGEYAAHSRTFLVLILAAAIYCVAGMFTSAMTSARCFMIQAPIYMLVAASNAVACAIWAPAAGLAGGAAAMVVAAAVHLVLGAAVVGYLLWAPARSPAYQQDLPPCANGWEGSV